MPEEKSGKQLRAGIVGMGRVGVRRANCIANNPHLKLEAICDVNEEIAAQYPQCAFYKEYEDLLQHDLDVIFACAFNNITPKVVVAGLEKGMHVFSEKPPGRSVEDVEAMIQAEEKRPELKLQFGFNHRKHYAVMEAKNMIDSGRYGEILWMRGVYGKCGGILFENCWRSNFEFAGGGILLDQGIHMLDLFRFFCGDFTDYKSFIETSFWNIELEDNAFAMMRNKKGQVATIHSSATQWKHKFGLEICLQGGYINLNGILSSTRSYGEECLTFARKQFEDEARAFGRPREETIFFDRDDSWQLEVDTFAETIVENKPVTSGNSADALAVMKMIEAIYKDGSSQ